MNPLYFWNFNNNKDDETPAADEEGEEKEEKPKGLGGLLPFFANKDEKETTKVTEVKEKEPVVAATTTSTTKSPAPAPRKPAVAVEEDDPVKIAQALRAQAERARLEAEKMDAELTLRKISRLEKEMATAIAKDETEDVERLQREMDALQAKIRGEKPPPPVPVATPPSPAKSKEAPKIEVTIATDPDTNNPTILTQETTIQMPILKQISQDDVETVTKTLESSPGFIKKLLAQMVEVDFVGADDINVTEVTRRMIQMQSFDYSWSARPKPSFTSDEIDRAMKENLIEASSVELDNLPEAVRGNKTAEALLALEYNYYVDSYDESSMDQLLDGEDWLKEVMEAVNKSDVDNFIERFYPKCTRKEDATLPSMAEVKMLMSDVLPKASFTPRGEPEQVLGGFVIRGTSKFESGDEMIDAIDSQLEKSPTLKDKMTVLYTKDFTLMADFESSMDMDAELPNPDDEPPIIFVMGPDIVPERRRIQLSVTTAFGIATSWYLSVYPFLLNPGLLKRVEEQVELADASMGYDLSWLSELSLPLFITFIGIQLAHEAGHKVMGAVNGVSNSLFCHL